MIAIFYSSNISLGWLGLAAILCVLIAVLTRLRVWQWPLYMLVGVFVWWAVLNSGVHATIAGVALGLLAPAKPLQRDSDARSVAAGCRTSRQSRSPTSGGPTSASPSPARWRSASKWRFTRTSAT